MAAGDPRLRRANEAVNPASARRRRQPESAPLIACCRTQLVSELVSASPADSTSVLDLNSVSRVLTDLGAEGGIRSPCLPVRATACQPNLNRPMRLPNR